MNATPMSDAMHAAMNSMPAHLLLRLTLAAVLGGIIGIERELKHRAAGLRTNMFICFGAAMFTVLSIELAGGRAGESTRIAAQIISGIGFIGAGSILHARGITTGLTTAATLFVVASIGMAAGGGLYLSAVFATLLVLLALYILGALEGRFNLKSMLCTYEVAGQNPEEMQIELNSVLEAEHCMMERVQIARAQNHYRLQFSVDGTRRAQTRLLSLMQQSTRLQSVHSLGPTEHE